MSVPLLRVRDVGWQAAGAPVLDRVSLDVAAGEFVAILGRNGAGKSTLLDIAAGVRRPGRGQVELAGRTVAAWSAADRARLLAHLPQQVRADLTMSGLALVMMGRYPHAHGWSDSAEDQAAAAEAMRRCGCFEFRDRRIATLSGGERQRVFLAACLAQRPRLLLLDEPATFLDVDQQLQCFALLRREAGRGTGCVAVTHDVNLALTFCSRLVVLAGGRVAHDIPSAAALDSPGWLALVSSRLEVERPGASAPGWVRYR